MIRRELQRVIETNLFKGKVISVLGARQVGKSTLMQQLTENLTGKVQFLNCDEPEILALLTDANTQDLRIQIGDSRIVVIDEAQQVPNIGMVLKRMVDNFPNVQVLVTGSSAFELQNKLNEPLTGRKYEYRLYPLSQSELLREKGLVYMKQTLGQRLIYGSYPHVVNHPEEAETTILEIADSYLYKDILQTEHIRRPVLIDKLLKALAFQVGSEVSYNELAQTIGTDNKTVEKYVDLLEKCFVVFRLNGLSRNLRNELKKGKKIYFYDNGIRNAVIQNFAPIDLRQDMGALWENFVVSELVKQNHYAQKHCFSYFWRTTQQQEIDYVEERNGVFTAYEMKWNAKRAKVTLPKTFAEAYHVSKIEVITPDNYLDYLTYNPKI